MSTELDPMPWQVYAEGVAAWRRNHHRERFTNAFGEAIFDRFSPRPGYNQNREDYVQ